MTDQNRPSIIEEAEKKREELEEIIKRGDERIKQMQEEMSRSIMAGKTTMNSPEPKKEETPEECLKRIQQERRAGRTHF